MGRTSSEAHRQLLLSEALVKAIRGRRVRTAIFTTFEFEPEFFELNVLPCLFVDRAWCHMPKAKLQQVDDALREVERVAVFFDRRGLRPTSGAAHLDYERIAVARPRGVFHAKNILLLVENAVEDGAEPGVVSESLLLMTTSANLTQAGWHENLEVAQVVEIAAGDASAVRGDLLHQRGLLSVLEDAIAGNKQGQPHPAIEAVRQFLLKEAASPGYLKQDGLLRLRLYVGRETLSVFLCEAGRVRQDEYCMEIISPFFENTADARTLRALIEAVRPVETRIYLPLGDDGQALCSGEFFETVWKMSKSNVYWARLPDDLTQWSGKSAQAKRRHVHAKVYRLFKGGRARADWRELQLVGSVNLTGAAHAGGVERNFETAMLVELPCEHEPDWWMTRPRSLPEEFEVRAAEDEAGRLACHELTLRFDWQTRELQYFWKAEPRKPAQARVAANNCPLFEFESIEFDCWRTLSEPAAQQMAEHLKSGSLVELIVEDEPPQPLLVQEINMPCKPPLLEKLTPAEILEYWSLLTPERRNLFLERKLETLLAQATGRQAIKPPAQTEESLFDRFAGVFHAFSCLEEHVVESLRRGAEKEARYRLLGESYDSLPTLARQVKTSEDPVVAYVTLLCAGEVFRRLRAALKRENIESDLLNPRLSEDHEAEWRKAREDIKKRVVLPAGMDGSQFFEWFDAAFSKPVRANLTQRQTEESQ